MKTSLIVSAVLVLLVLSSACLFSREPEEEGRIGFAECLLKELLAGEEGRCIRMIRKPGPVGDEDTPPGAESVPSAPGPSVSSE